MVISFHGVRPPLSLNSFITHSHLILFKLFPIMQTSKHNHNSTSGEPSVSSKLKKIETKICHPNYWLLKTEPEGWSWEDQHGNGGISVWDGVRNHAAQKNMKAMKLDDLCFFYHTGKKPSIMGIVTVTRTWYPENSIAENTENAENEVNSKWGMVDVKAVRALAVPVTLRQLKLEANSEPLSQLVLLKQSRLSVVPISEPQWVRICELAENSPASFHSSKLSTANNEKNGVTLEVINFETEVKSIDLNDAIKEEVVKVDDDNKPKRKRKRK